MARMDDFIDPSLTSPRLDLAPSWIDAVRRVGQTIGQPVYCGGRITHIDSRIKRFPLMVVCRDGAK